MTAEEEFLQKAKQLVGPLTALLEAAAPGGGGLQASLVRMPFTFSGHSLLAFISSSRYSSEELVINEIKI